MTQSRKKEIISQIIELITETASDKDNSKPVTPTTSAPIEMLTVKKCTDIIPGLSEHSVRKLIAHSKIKSIRTGEGKRGKILINKNSLIGYLQK